LTFDIALVLTILLASVVLFASEKYRADIVAMLVLAVLAVTRLVTPQEAFSGFANPAVEWTAIAFMVIGGIPFVLYIQATNGRPAALWRDSQVIWFIGIVIGASLAFTAWLMLTGGQPALDALRLAAFNAISVMTGTGYASTDYSLWGAFAVAGMFFLMSVGGCTGSTTGGIKVFRFTVLYAVARGQVFRLIRPHGVYIPTFNGRPLPEAAAVAVMAFIFLFGLCFAVFAVALSAFGLDYLTAMSGALTALANVGPGLGPEIGPAGNFSGLPDGAKWLLSLAMLLGRLELFTVLILFSPAFWRG